MGGRRGRERGEKGVGVVCVVVDLGSSRVPKDCITLHQIAHCGHANFIKFENKFTRNRTHVFKLVLPPKGFNCSIRF